MLEADGVPDRVAVLSKTADARQRLRHLQEGVEEGFAQPSVGARRQPSKPAEQAGGPSDGAAGRERTEREQLAALAEMGFNDAAACRRALADANYQLPAAAELLVAQREAMHD